MTTTIAPPKFSLDPLQRSAARAPEGPILLIGGAGTGKTRTLLGRISALIHGGASPFTITYLTFNSKSADNARKLLYELPIDPRTHRAIFIGTLHSYASNYLRQTGAAALGISPSYTIWDPNDASQVINDLLENLPRPIEEEGDEPFTSPDIENLLKWHTFNQARLPEDAIPPKNATWLKILNLYNEEKRRQQTLDLDDLIPTTIRAMESNQEDKAFWSRLRSRHLLIDEFQDITPIQYKMLQLMTGPTRSITIATDPNQNIYAWRGSTAELLTQFKYDHHDFDTHILKLNHRATLTLTNAATNLTDAEKMDGLYHSFQTAVRPKGHPPTVRQFHGHPRNMYRQILLDLKALRDQGVPWEDMACLYRKHHSFQAISTYLHQYNIPYNVLGDTNNLRDSTAKKVINLLNCLINPMDTKSFSIAAQAATNDNRKRMPSKIVNAINKQAKDRNTNLIEASKIFLAATSADASIKRNLSTFVNAWEELNTLLEHPNTDLHALCRRANTLVQDSTNYGLLHNPIPEITKLLTLSKTTPKLTKEQPKQHLTRFLELMATAPNPEQRSLDNEDPFSHNRGLTFASIHGAKGLQWSIVCILDATEASMPGANAEKPDNLLEEQRIFYVACTRATDQLYFFHHHASEPTRFIEAIHSDMRYETVELPEVEEAPRTPRR